MLTNTNKGATKLRRWLADNGKVHAWFADRIGCSPAHLSNILAGRDLPGAECGRKIRKETRGKVHPSDFLLQVEEQEAPDAAA